MPISVRPTTPGDRDSVIELVRSAFGANDSGGQLEVHVVRNTWALGAEVPDLDLVAVDAGVVGHVLCAVGDLAGTPAVAVAPLAVVPDRQRQGIGTALMTELLARADCAGWPVVLLLGDPAYYGRFGFEPAGDLGISYAPVGVGSPYFQVRRLSSYRGGLSGEFRYCWEI